MILSFSPPVWYSNDKKYVADVKDTDVKLISEPVDLSKECVTKPPAASDIESFIKDVLPIIHEQTASWFTSPLTVEKLQKKLRCDFQSLQIKHEQRYVTFVWVPKYFSIESNAFKLTFTILSMKDYYPRIPTNFLDPDTPRATTPVEENQNENTTVRNIVIHPDTQPEFMDDIPFSEHPSTLELRDEKSRERQRLREAKLRSAIARLKVEQLRERYLRHYGGEEVSEEEYEDDSSFISEGSEASHKKL